MSKSKPTKRHIIAFFFLQEENSVTSRFEYIQICIRYSSITSYDFQLTSTLIIKLNSQTHNEFSFDLFKNQITIHNISILQLLLKTENVKSKPMKGNITAFFFFYFIKQEEKKIEEEYLSILPGKNFIQATNQ